MRTFRVHLWFRGGWKLKLEREWSLSARTLQRIQFADEHSKMLRCERLGLIENEFSWDWKPAGFPKHDGMKGTCKNYVYSKHPVFWTNR